MRRLCACAGKEGPPSLSIVWLWLWSHSAITVACRNADAVFCPMLWDKCSDKG